VMLGSLRLRMLPHFCHIFEFAQTFFRPPQTSICELPKPALT
jgi:hypothetical protein